MSRVVKVPVSGTDGQFTTVPSHIHTADLVQLVAMNLGDGFFAFKGNFTLQDGTTRPLRELNGEVLPGQGLSVGIRDYIALIDGVVLTDKNKEQLNPNVIVQTLSVPVGTSYIVLKPTRTVEIDGVERPNHDKGVLVVESTPPTLNSGKVLVAKVVVPQNATQVTKEMIDNTVKDYLIDLDDLKQSLEEKIESTFRDIVQLILNQITAVREEIAAGDAAVLAQLDAKIAAVTGSIQEVRAALNDLQTFIINRLQQLQTISQQLQDAVASLQFFISNEVDAIKQRLQATEGQLSTMSVRLQSIEDTLPTKADISTVITLQEQLQALQGTTTSLSQEFTNQTTFLKTANAFDFVDTAVTTASVQNVATLSGGTLTLNSFPGDNTPWFINPGRYVNGAYVNADGHLVCTNLSGAGLTTEYGTYVSANIEKFKRGTYQFTIKLIDRDPKLTDWITSFKSKFPGTGNFLDNSFWNLRFDFANKTIQIMRHHAGIGWLENVFVPPDVAVPTIDTLLAGQPVTIKVVFRQNDLELFINNTSVLNVIFLHEDISDFTGAVGFSNTNPWSGTTSKVVVSNFSFVSSITTYDLSSYFQTLPLPIAAGARTASVYYDSIIPAGTSIQALVVIDSQTFELQPGTQSFQVTPTSIVIFKATLSTTDQSITPTINALKLSTIGIQVVSQPTIDAATIKEIQVINAAQQFTINSLAKTRFQTQSFYVDNFFTLDGIDTTRSSDYIHDSIQSKITPLVGLNPQLITVFSGTAANANIRGVHNNEHVVVWDTVRGTNNLLLVGQIYSPSQDITVVNDYVRFTNTTQLCCGKPLFSGNYQSINDFGGSLSASDPLLPLQYGIVLELKFKMENQNVMVFHRVGGPVSQPTYWFAYTSSEQFIGVALQQQPVNFIRKIPVDLTVPTSYYIFLDIVHSEMFLYKDFTLLDSRPVSIESPSVAWLYLDNYSVLTSSNMLTSAPSGTAVDIYKLAFHVLPDSTTNPFLSGSLPATVFTIPIQNSGKSKVLILAKDDNVTYDVYDTNNYTTPILTNVPKDTEVSLGPTPPNSIAVKATISGYLDDLAVILL